MKFDEKFYIQRNRDDSGAVVRLDDFENCRMRGTEKNPVQTQGKIEVLELEADNDVLGTPLEPSDKITLKLILSDPYIAKAWPRITRKESYYMYFLFYDFDRASRLFLFNAIVIKENYIPGIDTNERLGLTIVSAKHDDIPAYKVFETEHQEGFARKWKLNHQ